MIKKRTRTTTDIRAGHEAENRSGRRVLVMTILQDDQQTAGKNTFSKLQLWKTARREYFYLFMHSLSPSLFADHIQFTWLALNRLYLYLQAKKQPYLIRRHSRTRLVLAVSCSDFLLVESND